MRHEWNKRLVSAAIAASLMLGVASTASAFTPARAPLNLGGQVDPNVLFVIDDSGSMRLGFMPESLKYEWGTLNNDVCSTSISYLGGNKRVCPENGRRWLMSSVVNKSYFDPNKSYDPPARGDGTTFPNAVYTDAYIDGYKQSGAKVNLSSGYYAAMTESSSISGSGVYTTPFVVRSGTSGDGFYYRYLAGTTGCPAAPAIPARTNSCYERVSIGSDATLRQRFANWFSYYRNRLAVAQAGTSNAFAALGSDIRLGYGTINNGSTSVDGVNAGTVVKGVRSFAGTQRSGFFSWLHTLPVSTFTPLRRALDDAGQYYSRTDDQGPWSSTPGETGGETLSCRQSYTMLMTDGYWTEGDSYRARTADARSNVDNANGSTITGPDSQSYQYIAKSPFNDSYSNTLADVAMHYWKRDLLPLVPNRVPSSQENPAFWQHMVTYGISLGVTGTKDPTAAFAAIGGNTAFNWPNPDDSDEAKLDDLLHASVNGRGQFFAAQDNEEFVAALSNSLTNIQSRVGTNTSVVPNARRLAGDTLVYEAQYDSSNWSGKLTARQPIETSTGISFQERWEAGSLINGATRRSKLFTSTQAGAGNGRQLTWANVGSTGFFDSEAQFDYLLGSRIQEQPGGTFRRRGSLLGDIVNSTIVVDGKQDWGFHGRVPNGSGGNTYRSYVANKSGSGQATLLVGANDGFLHAFDADTGAERFAYMPNGVLSKVKSLASPNYTHDYFVDGKLTIRDYYNGGWKTVVVGGLGAGGKTMFALDITDASDFTNTNVLWEIKDDVDLGYTYSEPAIGRLRNGTWVAIFGNGPGSTENDSVLFIVNIATGAVTKVRAGLDTGGLSSPAFVYGRDDNGHIYIKDIYAGDLSGNLWKFRETSNNNNSSSIAVAYGSNNNPLALYTARNDSNQAQPITVRPEIAPHPDGDTLGNIIYFGTGSFYTTQDNANRDVQSIYGIWDRSEVGNGHDAPFSGRTKLDERSIIFEGTSSGRQVRAFDTPDTDSGELAWGTNMRGWYLDLDSPVNDDEGERVIFSPSILLNRLVISTAIPNDDPCASGGGGWTMVMNLSTGGRLRDTVLFDLNRDGEFDQGDMVNIGTDEDPDWVPVGGIGTQDGIPTNAFDQFTSNNKYFLCTGTGADSCIPTENSFKVIEGRQSWNQLFR